MKKFSLVLILSLFSLITEARYKAPSRAIWRVKAAAFGGEYDFDARTSANQANLYSKGSAYGGKFDVERWGANFGFGLNSNYLRVGQFSSVNGRSVFVGDATLFYGLSLAKHQNYLVPTTFHMALMIGPGVQTSPVLNVASDVKSYSVKYPTLIGARGGLRIAFPLAQELLGVEMTGYAFVPFAINNEPSASRINRDETLTIAGHGMLDIYLDGHMMFGLGVDYYRMRLTYDGKTIPGKAVNSDSTLISSLAGIGAIKVVF